MAKVETAKDNKVVFYRHWCKQCGICVALCPKGALEADKEGCPRLAKPELCNECGLCEVRCPDFAIAVPSQHDEED